MEQIEIARNELVEIVVTSFTYRCPNTGLQVEDIADLNAAAADDANHYQAVECLACQRIHLVNVATGKLLTDEREK